MKFDVVIGNPPYQIVVAKKETTNGQKATKSIFHYFQQSADDIVKMMSVMIYPGSRWIHRSGKGMEDFGLKQINDVTLKKVIYYPNGKDVFPTTEIADGLSIVVKEKKKNTNVFDYIYKCKDEILETVIKSPGVNLVPLYPKDIQITNKIEEFIKKNNFQYLSVSVLPRSLFNIESDFAEKNPTKLKLLTPSTKIDYSKEIKLFTNDKAGKAGRASWFITTKDVITTNSHLIEEWQVVVSSASPGGQKRDNQLEIIDNKSAFGRSRVALKSFKSHEESKNFYKYMQSTIIKFTLLMTDENLTSFAKKVPDIIDYETNKSILNFDRNIDEQLCFLMNITNEEFEYIQERVKKHFEKKN